MTGRRGWAGTAEEAVTDAVCRRGKKKKIQGGEKKNVGGTGESAEGKGWEEEEEERDAHRGGKNVGRRGGGELQVDGLNFKAARPDEVCGLTM